jgi:hypothetical protein
MRIAGITWRGDSIEDVKILPYLPSELVRILADTNGFILHEGALHVRGACLTPEWHSLRAAWKGPRAFHVLYNDLAPSDIPFAQDQVGDQFLLREGAVHRLSAETAEVEHMADNIQEFFAKVGADIEHFLNVGLSHKLEPGQLLQASPPFCLRESASGLSLAAVPASDLILFHADLAKQIRDLPDGTRVEIKVERGRRTKVWSQ